MVICPEHGLLTLEPDTPEWFAPLATLSSFRFVGTSGRLTSHREVQHLPGLLGELIGRSAITPTMSSLALPSA